MRRKENPLGLDIFYLSHFITELQYTLDRNPPRSLIKQMLAVLSHYKNYISIGFVGKDAQRIIKNIDEAYSDDSKPLDAINKALIREDIAEWRGVIDEISAKWALCVSEASLETARLLDGVESFLNKEELSVLEQIERHGLDECTRCLLHNSFTSAEFIALRTAESLLRRWYKKKSGNELKRERWGDILNELNDIYPKISGRPKELSLLDYLRLRRNEIDHPDATSTPDEASATFLNVIAVCKAVKSDLLT